MAEYTHLVHLRRTESELPREPVTARTNLRSITLIQEMNRESKLIMLIGDTLDRIISSVC